MVLLQGLGLKRIPFQRPTEKEALLAAGAVAIRCCYGVAMVLLALLAAGAVAIRWLWRRVLLWCCYGVAMVWSAHVPPRLDRCRQQVLARGCVLRKCC
jgi:cobalamin biosynthesis protein CobD/CbiB